MGAPRDCPGVADWRAIPFSRRRLARELCVVRGPRAAHPDRRGRRAFYRARLRSRCARTPSVPRLLLSADAARAARARRRFAAVGPRFVFLRLATAGARRGRRDARRLRRYGERRGRAPPALSRPSSLPSHEPDLALGTDPATVRNSASCCARRVHSGGRRSRAAHRGRELVLRRSLAALAPLARLPLAPTLGIGRARGGAPRTLAHRLPAGALVTMFVAFGAGVAESTPRSAR